MSTVPDKLRKATNKKSKRKASLRTKQKPTTDSGIAIDYTWLGKVDTEEKTWQYIRWRLLEQINKECHRYSISLAVRKLNVYR